MWPTNSRPPASPQAAVPAPARSAPSAPPPWEEIPPSAYDPEPDFSGAMAQKKTEPRTGSPRPAEVDADNGIAVLEAPPAALSVQTVPRARARAVMPVPSLDWNGDWPALAAALPLRGVVQQLAQQSELLECESQGEGVRFKLRIPLETLRSAGSVDKLANALAEHFGKPVRVDTEIGAVELTANAAAMAEREARQRQAEQSMQNDPFVQSVMREFGATIVPGSIKPL